MKTLEARAQAAWRRRSARGDAGLHAHARSAPAFDLADWEELRAPRSALVTIGSHTLTHPILTALRRSRDRGRGARQPRAARDAARPAVDTFAYPNGDLDPAADACVRRHYRVALRASGGWVKRGVDLYRLPRIPAPSGVLKLARRIYA